MKELVEYIVNAIVETPDAVNVEEEVLADGKIILTIHTAPTDVGLVIGKMGRTINSIRSLVKIKAIKEGKFVDVKVPSDRPPKPAPTAAPVASDDAATAATTTDDTTVATDDVEVKAPTDEPISVTGEFEEPTF